MNGDHTRPSRLMAVLLSLAAAFGVMAPAPAAAAPPQDQLSRAMDECDLIDLGVSGTCVITLQRWLNRLADADLDVDGRYGPATQAAVADFQEEEGLRATGRVDEVDKERLRAAYREQLYAGISTSLSEAARQDAEIRRQMADMMCNAVGEVLAFPALALPVGGPVVDLFAEQVVSGCTAGADAPPMPTLQQVLVTMALVAIDNRLGDVVEPLFTFMFRNMQPATDSLATIATNLWNESILEAIEQILDASVECFRTSDFPAPQCVMTGPIRALEDQLV